MEPGRNRFAAAVTLAFVLLAGLGLARHEMWRDELQAWLIPAGSGSPAELIHNLRYEGHPALWHSLLWIVSRFTQRPEAMQVLHLIISAAAVFLFVRSAPFSRPVRALFAFGYYPLYEYTVISRNYGLGLLLVFAACALFPTRKRSYLPLAAVLALLANANPYSWIVALAFAGALTVEALLDRELRRWDAALGLLVFLAAAGMAAAQMIPPPDGRYATAWYLGWHWPRGARVLATLSRALLPIPRPGEPTAWNTNALWAIHRGAATVIAPLLIAASIAALRRSRTALLLYLGGTAALLGFTYVKYIGYTRHHGAHFLLLLACLWIARSEAPDAGRRRDVALALLLAVNVAGGAWVYAQDLQRPFSAAKATAAFLRGPAYREAVLVGYPDMTATPISGYLGRPFLYPQSRAAGTYVLWNERRRPALHFGEYCRVLRRQVRQRPEGIVLVTNQPAPLCGARMPPQEIASFQDGLLQDERFRIFRIQMLPMR